MRVVRFAPGAVAALLIVAWKIGNTCGPFIPVAQFHEANNWIDRGELIKGRLGIVRPTFFRKSLFTAYRYLTNFPLSRPEIDVLYPANPPDPYGVKDPVQTAADAWLAERKLVSPTAPAANIYIYRALTPDGLAVFDNCLEDTFSTAMATLQRKIALWGASHPNTAEWLRGQDAVFANCNGGPTIPAELPAPTDTILAADRRYQIAAAEFYARRFPDALRDFASIAQDSNSEWRNIAPYLAARTLLRQASLENHPEALVEAKRRLGDVAADPNAGRWRDSARGLLDLIQIRQNPSAYLIETAERLSRPNLGNNVLGLFNDFNHVWDQTPNIPSDQAGLVDWILTFQNPSAGTHALARWRETRSPVWLIAALQHASNDASTTSALIEAAAAVRPSETAYATATYLGIKLQTGRDHDAARQWADSALATHQPMAVDNEFRGERMALARDWTEFLRYAPRTPIAQSVDLPDVPLDKPRARRFDADAAYALNQIAPLTRLAEAPHSPLLPRNLQLELARAAWTRAAILGDTEAANNLAVRLSELQPELAPDLKAFLSATDRTASQYAAVYVMLRNPGLAPVVGDGFPRPERTNQIDSYRDNWWNLASGPSQDTATVTTTIGPITYLTAPEIAEGRAEFARLVKVAGIAVNYLAASTIAWAHAHPADPRNSEALALVVRSTRFGITDKETTNWSKSAFQLLHRSYPNSVWAQKTKYWY